MVTLRGLVVAGRDAAPAEMQDKGFCMKLSLKTPFEFQSIALEWKCNISTSAGGRAAAHWDTPSRAGGGLGIHGISLLPPSPPSLVSKQEVLNAFYVVTQMMKGPKMRLTKMSCTSE